jgi:hypothetical protein
MKSKTLLTCFIAILSCFSLFENISTRKVHGEVPINNKYYRFYWGIITRLIGREENLMSQCLPPAWLNKNPQKEDAANVVASLTAVQAALSKISILLTKRMDHPCKDKPYIVQHIVKTQHFKEPTPSKKRRLFAQMVKKLTTREESQRTKLGPFAALSLHFKDLKNSVTGFFDLPVVKESLAIFPCLGEKYKHIKSLTDTCTELLVKVAKLKKNNNETIEVLVDSLCTWHRFRRSIHFLNASFKQNNSLTRWQGFGYFMGRLASAIANV